MNARFVYCALAALLHACGSDVDVSNAGSISVASTGGGGSAGQGGSGGQSDGGGGGSSGLCGGVECSDGPPFEWCAYLDGECGTVDPSMAECREVPLDCIYEPGTWEPVCECDGVIKEFYCGAANTTSFDKCNVIACGASQCDKATEYCEVVIDTSTYTCRPLPPGCTACSCLGSEPCGQSCAGTAESGMRLLCAPTP
jgi:hypothetical protein